MKKNKKYLVKYRHKEYGINKQKSEIHSAVYVGRSVNDVRTAVLGVGRFLNLYVDIISITTKR